jgi:hypothetical protein
MVRIVVDPATQARLEGLQVVAELCDASGRVLGRVVPVQQEVILEPQISEEELRRREAEGGGRPLAEILADLEKLA